MNQTSDSMYNEPTEMSIHAIVISSFTIVSNGTIIVFRVTEYFVPDISGIVTQSV